MRLTENFTLEELTATCVAAVNSPDTEAVVNLVLLAVFILQPLRDAWGDAICVNSGYRSATVNKAVGGVRDSQHLQGQAADITVGSPARNHELFQNGNRPRFTFRPID